MTQTKRDAISAHTETFHSTHLTQKRSLFSISFFDPDIEQAYFQHLQRQMKEQYRLSALVTLVLWMMTIAISAFYLNHSFSIEIWLFRLAGIFLLITVMIFGKHLSENLRRLYPITYLPLFIAMLAGYGAGSHIGQILYFCLILLAIPAVYWVLGFTVRISNYVGLFLTLGLSYQVIFTAPNILGPYLSITLACVSFCLAYIGTFSAEKYRRQAFSSNYEFELNQQDLQKETELVEKAKYVAMKTNHKLSMEIAARKKTELELERHRNRLQSMVEERTEKWRLASEEALVANEAKTEFLRNITHELRTPLNSIIGFSEIMQQEVYGPIGNAEYKENIDIINNSGNQLLVIINDILEMSQIEIGNITLNESRMNIPQLIESLTKLIQAKAREKSINLEFNISADFPLFYADRTRLKQSLLKLIKNAIQYTPEAGNVSVHFSLDVEKNLLIEIEDTGCGMSEDQIINALLPFRQVYNGENRKHEGTGLGLSLAKRYIECHGGSLRLTSVLNQGTKAIILLPRYRHEDYDL